MASGMAPRWWRRARRGLRRRGPAVEVVQGEAEGGAKGGRAAVGGGFCAAAALGRPCEPQSHGRGAGGWRGRRLRPWRR